MYIFIFMIIISNYVDIDECSAGTSGCSQLCTNTIGSYYCSCYSGYSLDHNGHNCTVSQQSSSSAYGTDFYVGAMRNYRGAVDQLLLYIATPSASPVAYSIETNSGTFTNGTVNSSVPAVISLSTSLVTNDGLYSSRFKGIHIHSTDGGLLSVLVVNRRSATYGDYLAYPYQNLGLSQYQYYAVSTGTLAISENSLSEVLIVGNEDNTTVTVVPTQTVTVPVDIQTNSGSRTVAAGSPFTFTIHRMQTFLFGVPVVDISGTSIASDKPLTVVSGHECGNIPLVCCCQQIAEQIPPTVTWGTRFLTTPYMTRSVGPYFKVIAANNETTLSFTCGSSSSTAYLPEAGNVTTLLANPGGSYCSIVSNKPVLVTQLGPSQSSGSGQGDPVISMVPPLEQYMGNITFVLPGISTISSHYANIATTMNGSVFIDGQLESVTWNTIYDSSNTTIGYGALISFGSRSTSTSHTISMSSGFSTLVYGFGSNRGYSYSAGVNIYQSIEGKLVCCVIICDNDLFLFSLFTWISICWRQLYRYVIANSASFCAKCDKS